MRASLLLAAVSLGGCFYLQVINVAPVAQIRRLDAGEIHVHDSLRLSAEDSQDDDGDPLTFEWTARSCAGCIPIAGSEMELTVPVSAHDPIAVSLTVVDGHGARSAVATRQYAVTDRAPSVRLSYQGALDPDGHFKLAHPIDFLAVGQDEDGDALTYEYTVEPPPQSDPEALVVTHFEDPAALRIVPDAPGLYTVAVTVDDGFGMQDIDRVTVEVGADEPPCLAATSPTWSPDGTVIVVRADGPRRFSVDSVTDDLDGYPGGGIHFRWFVSSPDQPLVEVPAHDLPDLVLDPADLDPGDQVAVRVEITDRVARTLPCAFDQAACSIGGDDCFQRLTWTVEAR